MNQGNSRPSPVPAFPDPPASLAEAMVDSLSAHLALLDTDGSILAVNRAWRLFALENGGDGSTHYVGANYLDVCERAIASGEGEEVVKVRDGLRALVAGADGPVSVEYPCDSPSTRRWFVARMSRFEYGGSSFVAVAHEDVTERRQSEDACREAERVLRGVLEALPVGIWVLDREGTIVHGNPAGRTIWAGARYVGPEQFGEYKGWWLDSGKPIAADEWAAARAIRSGEASIDEEILIECFDGTRKIILNSALPLRDDEGDITGAIIVNQDVTARKRAEQALARANAAKDALNTELQLALARERQNARTDHLTGLTNRRHFMELAEAAVDAARSCAGSLALVLFDLDHFKDVNDVYGHLAGDTMLQELAAMVYQHVRADDVVGRFGGEEFILLLPEAETEDAMQVAESLRCAIAESTFVGEHRVKATISAGVATLGSAGDTLDALVHRADQALYAAKRAGRNCVRSEADLNGRG